MTSYGSNAGMETSAPLISIRSITLCFTATRILLPQIIHILRFFWYTRCCPLFCNEMYWGQGGSAARNL